MKINWFGFDLDSSILGFNSVCGVGVQVFIMEEAIKEEHLEALKTDVWTKLPQLNVEELEQVCTALDRSSKSGKEVCSIQCCNTALNVKHCKHNGA